MDWGLSLMPASSFTGATRSWAGLVWFAIAALACSTPDAGLERPLEGSPDVELAPVDVAGTTRLGFCLEKPGDVELGDLARGTLHVDVSVSSTRPMDSGSVELRLRDGRRFLAQSERRCAVDLGEPTAANQWHACELPLEGLYRDAVLDVDWSSVREDDTVCISSPLLIGSEAPQGLPLVFVIVVDTTRIREVRTFSAEGKLRDGVGRLQRDGITFERARAPTSWTRPSVASLLTGVSPMRHRVFGRYDILGTELVTLPEVFQDSHYVTMGWTTNPNVLPVWGFARGFDVFKDLGTGEWNRAKPDGRTVFLQVQDAVEGNEGHAAFHYIHVIDPHVPYRPGKWGRAAAKAAVDILPAKRAKRRRYLAYVGEIFDVNRELGRFFRFLDTRGLYDDALILVVSDHGEEFGEHGGVRHGKTLYEEMLHVPAWLKLPGNALAGTRIDDYVALADFPATVLNALDLPLPEDLKPTDVLAVENTPSLGRRPHVATLRVDGKRLAAVVDGPWKLIRDELENREMLFHLGEDPGELQNRVETDREKATELRTLLDSATVASEEDLHVRVCGHEGPSDVNLVLSVRPEAVQPRALEAGDALSERAGELHVDLGLEPTYRSRLDRQGKEGAYFNDEDELLIDAAGLSQGGSWIRSASGSLPYALGNSSTLRRGPIPPLESLFAEATVESGEAIACVADAGETHLRIWYVQPGEALDAGKVDEALAERLRALGYAF
ncbi:MAG: sulfatase [Candidatus Binatia bacterium]|nr:sulfatase [Candidatus Binatia bacterium]